MKENKSLIHFLLFCFAIFTNTVNAADLDADSNAEFTSGLNLDGLIQVSSALVIIIVIIMGLSLILRKLNMVPGSTTGVIKIISGLSLSNKDRLLLVEVGNEQILLSVSSGNINKLHQLANPVNLNELPEAEQSNNKFADLLKTVVKRQKK